MYESEFETEFEIRLGLRPRPTRREPADWEDRKEERIAQKLADRANRNGPRHYMHKTIPKSWTHRVGSSA